MERGINKTPLHDLHAESGARFVDFAGYEMPLQYRKGIRAEHLHTRSSAGLFDVSHMGQMRLSGDAIERRIESLVTGDICALQPFRLRYTLLTNHQGGIIDDLMLTRMPEHLFLVVNAACKQSDYTYLKETLGPGYRVEMLDDRALLALQGPAAADVLGRFHEECRSLPFLGMIETELQGMTCYISRCGYTGEDGFEISVPAGQAGRLAETLLQDGRVELIGLAARDTLRLEAGLCLYGHDIDADTTPVEAGLNWVIAAKYRNGSAPAMFPGADRILHTKPRRLRCGFRIQGRVPVREGASILNAGQQVAGRITSGGFAPSLGQPVAMGYIDREYADTGTELLVEIRHDLHTIRVADLPFVKHRYYQS